MDKKKVMYYSCIYILLTPLVRESDNITLHNTYRKIKGILDRYKLNNPKVYRDNIIKSSKLMEEVIQEHHLETLLSNKNDKGKNIPLLNPRIILGMIKLHDNELWPILNLQEDLDNLYTKYSCKHTWNESILNMRFMLNFIAKVNESL